MRRVHRQLIIMGKYRVLFKYGDFHLWANIETNVIDPPGEKGYIALSRLAVKSCMELIPGIEKKEKPTDIIIEKSMNEESTHWEVICYLKTLE